MVKPPALDLANRDLIEAHLHAVWLAESSQELQADIPHVLDLDDEALPIQTDIANAFADPDLTVRDLVVRAGALGRSWSSSPMVGLAPH